MTDRRRMSGHVIACGLDGVALRTIEQLHLAGVAVVVVDEAAEGPGAQVVAGWGIARIAGSPRRREVLDAAGLAGAVAVVCVQDEDLHALETALLVHRLRPDVRVVAALSNPSVGTAVADLIGPGSVLDVAALAAPSVVEACLRRREHRLEVEGVAFVAAEVDPDVAGTLRELYGDLAPIAVVPGGEENEIVVCPGRDHQVHPGDLVTVFGTAEDVAPRLAGTHRPQAVVLEGRSSAAVRVLSAPLRLARTLAGESDRAIRLTLGILLAVLALSVVLLRIGYRKPDGAHMTVLDAIYFTIETVGTIGYGDYYFAAQATWLRVYAVALMIVGATLATILFALLTNLLVSRRIAESMGRRTVGRLSGHAIVIGLGSVGVRVVEGLLAEGRHVVVVDRDEDNRYLSQVRALGVPVVIADATQRATLRAVGLGAASSVAVLTSDDLVNIETGLAVRAELAGRWGEVPVVLRVFDTSLGETVEEGFGFDDVRSTSQLAAPWFVGAALGLSVLGTFYVERTPFLIARLVVAAKGGLDGLAMQELSARTQVVAIRRARTQGLEHPPRSGTRFQAGDEAYIVGPYSELLQVLRRDGASVSQLASGGQDAPAVQGRDQVVDGVQLH